jgi:dTDP-4-dehydrorhamnose reductase
MEAQGHLPPLEVWTGIECTVNRVGNRNFDQLLRTGHHARLSDLDLVADLGVRTVRYGILWERTAPGALADADWTWPDQRLRRLAELGIDPIVGLLHHGSGPRHTDLLDPAFPGKLAAYARAVAERYPGVKRWTPVNEPLTTARFSALYGHWYPHAHDPRSFVRALLHQCRGTALAMQAVRGVNPDAQLIHTEDLGHTHAGPELAYQAVFDNRRSMLGTDLLCGRVDRRHPLYEWLRDAGATEAELAWHLESPCVPDVFGCNYYPTSERLLDPELDRWPAEMHGGNGRHRYADVAAVQGRELRGVARLLTDVWERYQRPVAITECHLGCTREEQLRWLLEVWDEVGMARSRGVPVVAFTPWAMFGSYDWHCLMVRDEGRYEPGLFDVRGPSPRPTALAAAVRTLAAGGRPEHPTLDGPGWWRRPTHPAEQRAS